MSDYIKLHRSMLEWEWYGNINTKVLFIHMLLRANWKERKFEGKVIERGSFVSSIDNLSKETDLTKDEVRTALKHLISTNEITKQSFSKFTVFTVNNYDEYQDIPKQLPSNSHSIPTLFPTIEEKKEGKKERNNISCAIPEESHDSFFERIWKLYPVKKGKGQVSKAKKQVLQRIGYEELERCIDRFVKTMEKENRDKQYWMNGSTFFNSGYVDYLDKNWTDTERSIKTNKPVSKNMFNDFKQHDYDFDDLEKRLLAKK